MTPQEHPTAVREAVQLLAEQGFDGMAQIMQLLLNECMRIERRQSIGAGPYERSEVRRGQANGFKPKTVKTRVLKLDAKFIWSAIGAAGGLVVLYQVAAPTLAAMAIAFHHAIMGAR